MRTTNPSPPNFTDHPDLTGTELSFLFRTAYRQQSEAMNSLTLRKELYDTIYRNTSTKPNFWMSRKALLLLCGLDEADHEIRSAKIKGLKFGFSGNRDGSEFFLSAWRTDKEMNELPREHPESNSPTYLACRSDSEEMISNPSVISDYIMDFFEKKDSHLQGENLNSSFNFGRDQLLELLGVSASSANAQDLNTALAISFKIILGRSIHHTRNGVEAYSIFRLTTATEQGEINLVSYYSCPRNCYSGG